MTATINDLGIGPMSGRIERSHPRVPAWDRFFEEACVDLYDNFRLRGTAKEFARAVCSRGSWPEDHKFELAVERGRGQTTVLSVTAAYIAQSRPSKILLATDQPDDVVEVFKRRCRGVAWHIEHIAPGLFHLRIDAGSYISKIVVADPPNADAENGEGFDAIIGDLHSTIASYRGAEHDARRTVERMPRRVPAFICVGYRDRGEYGYVNDAGYNYADPVARMETIRARHASSAGVTFPDAVVSPASIELMKANHRALAESLAYSSAAAFGVPAKILWGHCDPIKDKTDQPAASHKAAAVDPMEEATEVARELGKAAARSSRVIIGGVELGSVENVSIAFQPDPESVRYVSPGEASVRRIDAARAHREASRAARERLEAECNAGIAREVRKVMEVELDRIAAELGPITVVDNPTAADRFAAVVRAGANAYSKLGEAAFNAADAAFGFVVCFVFDAIDAGCWASRLPGRFVRFVASRLSSVRGFVSRSEGSLTMFSKASLGFVAGMIACTFGPGLLRSALPPAMPPNQAAAAASYYTVSAEPAAAAVPAWTEVTIIGTEFDRDKGDSQVVESSDGRRFVITGQWGKNGDTFKAPTSELRATQAEGIAGWFASSTR